MNPLPEMDTNPGRRDIRPIVASSRRDLPPWMIAVIALIGAVLLFSLLDARRRATTTPTTAVRVVDAIAPSSSLPPLYVPPDYPVPPPPPPPMFSPAPIVSIPQPVPSAVTPVTAAPVAAPSFQSTQAQPPVTLVAAPVSAGGPVLVFDGTGAPDRSEDTAELAAATAAGGAASEGRGSDLASGGRARSTRLGQLANTVQQGALIPAVLETALDSTRPGHVRALVSRDVRGFDGTRVLIPRGSRLFGEYRADLSPGQNRAFVRWTRLVRPDGVSIDLDSLAADALGRAGVQGRVNSHFFERFSSALLQTTMSVGVALAGRGVSDSALIVALPGATQSLTTPTSGQVQPTLTVGAGVSVTVFVARDLTFPGVEARR